MTEGIDEPEQRETWFIEPETAFISYSKDNISKDDNLKRTRID